jgi:hypothetical protein
MEAPIFPGTRPWKSFPKEFINSAPSWIYALKFIFFFYWDFAINSKKIVIELFWEFQFIKNMIL